MHEQPLTVKQTASLYGLKERTLWNWIRKGHLARIKVGRNVFILPSTLEAFLRAHESRRDN